MRLVLILVLCWAFAPDSATYGQWFCPYPVAGHPFTATWVETNDQVEVSSVQVARSHNGSSRCANPQIGRSPDLVTLTDIPHARTIYYGCAQVVTDPRRGLLSACQGQSATVRPYPARAQYLTTADVELRLQKMAAEPPTSRTEGTLNVERRVLGQRLVHDVLCVGFEETRRGMETGLVRGSPTQQQANRTFEEWISPLYGVMESFSTDLLHNTHSHGSLQNFQLREPAAELLAVPPNFVDILAEAIAASPQTVSISEPK